MEQDTCEYCQQALNNTEKLVTVYRKRRDRHFIFERVPARVCAGCGERYFSAQVVREMDHQMRQTQDPKTMIAVPVIELKLAS
ncbi:MAG: YgiT-type zinc finger protein [Blastocatellia bacterium]